MGMKSGTTFKKRQKEAARMEKARDKAAKREERKGDKVGDPEPTDEELIAQAMNRVMELQQE